MPRLLALFRCFYAPLFFVGFITAGLLAVADGEADFALVGLGLLAIAISFGAERIAPFEPVWNRSKGDGLRDVAHALVNEGATVLALSCLPWLGAHVPQFAVWPAGWPLALQLLLAIGVADIGITLAHFASHRVGLLWRFHAVHHSTQRMYGFNGLMKHPIHQGFETLCGTTPLLLIGIPFEVAALLALAVVIQLLLQHANVDMRIGRLGHIWAIASGHRHHHVASATLGDVNFGLFSLIWDHALGTAVVDRPAPRDGELGVADRPDYPIGYGQQLVEPFRDRTEALGSPG